MSNDIDLSVILVNYNAAELTKQAVQSVLSTTKDINMEIIIVENGSCPEEKYQEESAIVKVLRNVKNKGFGHACNVGVAAASGDYLLFLNNDTIVHPHAIDDSIAYVRNMHKEQPIGALSVRIQLTTGKIDHGCKRGFPTPLASFFYFSKLDRLFPNNKTISAYRQSFVPEDAIAEVDAVSGAYLLIGRQVFEQIGGFDEEFFMYGEDIDLCYRLKQAGYRNLYYGKATITHLRGQSGLEVGNERVITAFYTSMKGFYQKHYQQKYNPLVTTVVYIGIQLKYWFASIRIKRRWLHQW